MGRKTLAATIEGLQDDLRELCDGGKRFGQKAERLRGQLDALRWVRDGAICDAGTVSQARVIVRGVAG